MSKGTAVDQSTDPALRFDPLFEDHYQAIFRYCVRRVGLPDAEDATADVFAVAWRRLDDLPQGEGSRAWLYGVAYRVVGNQYRTQQRRHRLASRLQAQGAGGVPDDAADPEVEVLYQAFDSLSGGDQELLRLSSWDGLTRTEIAQVLGIKENAVDQRLHRARSRLKARMARLDPGLTNSEETAQ